MKRLIFLFSMLLVFSVSTTSFAQFRLSSKDTSTVNETVFAVQDAGSWRQLPYSVLADSLAAQTVDKDPRGAVMAEKISSRNGLVPRFFGIADSDYFTNMGINLLGDAEWNSSFSAEHMRNTRRDSTIIRFYGNAGMSQVYGGSITNYGIGGTNRALMNNTTINESATRSSDLAFYRAWGQKIDYTGTTYSYTPTDLILSNITVDVGTPDDWTHTVASSRVRSTRDSIHNVNHKATYWALETTPNGSTTPVRSLEVTEREAKIYAWSLRDADYIKVENGVLEAKTALETLNDLANSAPTYQDNTAAVSGVGVGKVWKDNTGYLRVSY